MAVDPRASREFVALDLETTGLSPEFDRIVEVGAIRFDASGREIARFEQLVNPERPIPLSVQAIHGIDDAAVADAPTAAQVVPSFLNFLGDSSEVLLAHNAAFDARFLGLALHRLGLSRTGHAIVDTLALSRARRPDLRNHRLDTLARLFDLDPHGPHRALADSLRVMGLWLALDGPAAPQGALAAYPFHAVEAAPEAPIGWDPIVAAITNGWRVRMEYVGGSRGSAPREITPRSFLHRGGTAYLVAYCHIDQFEKHFRLDRVQSYEVVRPRSGEDAAVAMS